MNELTTEERFEWLDAGRALGDLTPEEEAEWKELDVALHDGDRLSEDVPFDAIVASLEQELSPAEAPPEGLAERVREGAKEFERTSPQEHATDEPIEFPRIWKLPAVAWATAACLAFAWILQTSVDRGGSESPDPSDIAASVEREPDALRWKLKSAEDDTQLRGEVVWSDARQEGVLLLEGVPVNDPTEKQYQLWIVDSERDDTHPVDGGVFDVPADAAGTIGIPIDAKLRIDQPAAFVITLEQPGGVVVSKQKEVVAIATS